MIGCRGRVAARPYAVARAGPSVGLKSRFRLGGWPASISWVHQERLMTTILVMETIPLADAKARLSAVLDEVRNTHERVVITRNGRPEAVLMAVTDLEALE